MIKFLISVFCSLLISSSAYGQDFEDLPVTGRVFRQGKINAVDYDNDGDLDIFGAGYYQYPSLFRNTDNEFERFPAFLPQLDWVASAFGDYDNDGDLDLALQGIGTGPDFPMITRLYSNDLGHFELQDTSFVQAYACDVDFGDFNNDGILDLAILQYVKNSRRTTLNIYAQKDSRFVKIFSYPFIAEGFGLVDWGDYDNDGDLDIVAGVGNHTTEQVVIFNNVAGSFSQSDHTFDYISEPKVVWADFNNDGWLDLFYGGNEYFTHYINDQHGGFIERDTIQGYPLHYGSVTVGDYNNDGLKDVAFSHYGGPTYVTNRIDSVWIPIAIPVLTFVSEGSILSGDFDRDGRLDIVNSSHHSNLGLQYKATRLYRNLTQIINTKPTAPTNLQADVSGTSVTFSWDAATDEQTASPGLTYNLWVGTTQLNMSVMSPQALFDGTRLLPDMGNVQHNLQWTLKNLPTGTLYARVQAIDAAFAGGDFSEMLTITNVGNKNDNLEAPTHFEITSAYPNPFTESVLIEFEAPKTSKIEVTVYDLLGHKVNSFDFIGSANQFTWDGNNATGDPVSNGVYFLQMRTADAVVTQKVIRQ